uniref:Tumor protein p53 inducible nuclear protein 2 n=1 Tax=Poecilia formosa TaxID=48698 RepID=A0A087XS40_POEFO
MFQRLSNLLFGDVEEVAADLKGPNPCVTEADEEGWMLVNLAGESKSSGMEWELHRCRPVRRIPPDLHPMATCSGSECGESGGASRSGSERGCMDESWFVTPPPCFTAEGATAETSPMEDLLIEHPSMSVYVSPNNLICSRVTEPAAPPATRSTMPTRVSRGAAAQAGALAKVTQVARVQRYKARMERRHLSRSHIQRQNRVREQVPRHASHARNTFLHQPSKRNFCH